MKKMYSVDIILYLLFNRKGGCLSTTPTWLPIINCVISYNKGRYNVWDNLSWNIFFLAITYIILSWFIWSDKITLLLYISVVLYSLHILWSLILTDVLRSNNYLSHLTSNRGSFELLQDRAIFDYNVKCYLYYSMLERLTASERVIDITLEWLSQELNENFVCNVLSLIPNSARNNFLSVHVFFISRKLFHCCYSTLSATTTFLSKRTEAVLKGLTMGVGVGGSEEDGSNNIYTHVNKCKDKIKF